MKLLAVVIFLFIGVSIQAQQVTINDKVYEVKKSKILNEGVDVTNTLSEEEKGKIFTAFEKNKLELKALKNQEKRIEEAEKKQRQAEKKHKKALKALNEKQKAQSKFDKAEKKFQQATKKYEKLEKKGKLSPKDKTKWLDKLNKLKANVSKVKKRLRKV